MKIFLRLYQPVFFLRESGKQCEAVVVKIERKFVIVRWRENDIINEKKLLHDQIWYKSSK